MSFFPFFSFSLFLFSSSLFLVDIGQKGRRIILEASNDVRVELTMIFDDDIRFKTTQIEFKFFRIIPDVGRTFVHFEKG